jgi:hypothetical protein
MSDTGILAKALSVARSEAGAIKEDTLAIALSMFAMLDQELFGQDSRGQAMSDGIVGSVITVVVVGVVGIVGILIYSEVNTAISLPTDSNLASAQTGLTDGFGSAMELLPIVLIVVVASLVIAVIGRFR